MTPLGAVTVVMGGVGAGTMAVANSTGGGPDYLGIAALITAASGALGTLVMAFLAVTRRRSDVPLTPEQIAAAVKQGLEEGDKHAS